jgi:hypothetical protein
VEHAQLCDFLEWLGQLLQLAAPTEEFDSAELFVCGATRPDKICVIGVREPVCTRASCCHHGTLFEEEHGLASTGKREDVRDRLQSFRICDRMATAVEYTELDTFFKGHASEKVGAVQARAADLEMWRSWAAQGASAEERAADVGRATARAGDDTTRRMFDWCESGGEYACLVEHLKSALVASDVQLVARSALEAAPAIRADLGGDAERPQKAEGPARDCRVDDVEMHGHFTASFQVDAARRVKKPRELG